MGTRAFIGIKNSDGTVRSIYSHYDNYPSGTGLILLDNYNTEKKINKLLDLGDMSSVGPKPIGVWDGPRDYCQTYKARGEKNVDARITTEEDFLHFADEDYTYLFKDGKWYVRNWGSPFEELSKIMDGEVDFKDEED